MRLFKPWAERFALGLRPVSEKRALLAAVAGWQRRRCAEPCDDRMNNARGFE